MEMYWDCPYCGLETPTPAQHLRVHGLTIEEYVKMVDAHEKELAALERLLLMAQEFLGEST